MNFIKPITFYNSNTPYYYEYDNLPIEGLEANDVLLNDYFIDLKQKISLKSTINTILDLSASNSESIRTWANNKFFNFEELFDGTNTTTITKYQTDFDAIVDDTIENTVLRVSEVASNRVLNNYARLDEVPDPASVTTDIINAINNNTNIPAPDTYTPFITNNQITEDIVPDDHKNALDGALGRTGANDGPFITTEYEKLSYDAYPIKASSRNFFEKASNKGGTYTIRLDSVGSTNRTDLTNFYTGNPLGKEVTSISAMLQWVSHKSQSNKLHDLDFDFYVYMNTDPTPAGNDPGAPNTSKRVQLFNNLHSGAQDEYSVGRTYKWLVVHIPVTSIFVDALATPPLYVPEIKFKFEYESSAAKTSDGFILQPIVAYT